MKNFKKIACFAYMSLSILASITVVVSLFTECIPITQVGLIIQAVGFAFVSGLLFET
jgi:hypothetical protein